MSSLQHILTQDQLAIQSATRDFARRHAARENVRAEYGDERTSYRVDSWRLLTSQLGAQGILIPEELGGIGAGLDDLVGVSEELGRELYCGPFLSTVGLATSLLLALGRRQQIPAIDVLTRKVATGEASVGLAYMGSDGSWPNQDLRGIQSDGKWLLSGSAHLVLDADIADAQLVLARVSDEWSIFLVEAPANNMAVGFRPSIDPSRQAYTIEFRSTEALRVHEGDDALSLWGFCLDIASVVLAAEQVGGAKACLDMSVEYSANRYQFGSPIGSFQAIQHMCANVLLDIEAAGSAVLYAAWAHAEGSAEFAIASSVAKAVASDAFIRAATSNMQIHGSMGYTFEHDAHMYFRRAKWSSLFLGSSDRHRFRIADLLGV